MIELTGSSKDLGGFSVSRILPNSRKRMVGPFVFLDHMGPALFEAGNGIDVRPHPHIGLSTITYLFEGSMLHRDSLGNNVEVMPGDVNWMTSGKGIVHSERETIEVTASQHPMDGLQSWVALPREFAEIEPSFAHVKKCDLPHWIFEGVTMRLIIGEAYGMTSPIKSYSPMFYLDCVAKGGKTIARPNPHHECAIYVKTGSVQVGDTLLKAGSFVLLEDEQEMITQSDSRIILLGGEHWPETPHLYWNFVSFDKERIEKAKQDWREQRFPTIPGDNLEYIPLPD